MTDERENLPSCSDFGALALCPGKFAACQSCPPPPQSDDAAEGTAYHAVLHEAAKTGILPDDAPDACVKAWSEVKALQERFRTPRVSLTEERLWYGDPPLFSGKPDMVCARIVPGDNCILVVDYKFGRLEVEPAENNLQLAGLAVLMHEVCPVTPIVVAIVAPYCGTTVAVYDRPGIEAAYRQVVKVATDAMKPDATRKAGEKQCRYCAAKASCPEYAAWIAPATELVPVQQGLTKADVKAKVLALPPSKLAELWRLSKPVDWLMAEVDARLKAMHEQELAAIGLQIKPGTVEHPIEDIATVFQRCAESYGVTADEFLACCKCGKGDLEKLVKAKSGLKGKELEREMDRILEGATVEKRKAGSLAELITEKTYGNDGDSPGLHIEVIEL